MADSQLLGQWEYAGLTPQVIEAGELLWGEYPIWFEWLQAPSGEKRFVWRHGGDDGSWTLAMGDIGYFSDEALVQYIAKFARLGLIWRICCFGSERVRIRPSGVGMWMANQEAKEPSPFSVGHRIAGLTSSQTYNRLLQLLAKPSSDICVARKFHRGSKDENWGHIFGYKNTERFLEAYDEQTALCRDIVRSDETLWRENSSVNWRFIAAHQHKEARFDVYCIANNQWLESPYLDLWASLISRFGDMQPRLKRRCRQEFFDEHPWLTTEMLVVPSYHERLEAVLSVREWGRSHVPADVFSELERFGL